MHHSKRITALFGVLLIGLVTACQGPSQARGNPNATVSVLVLLSTATFENTSSPTRTLIPEASATPAGKPTQPAAGLDGKTLENATYPVEQAKNGHAALLDGEYRQEIAPGSASEIIVRVVGFTFGDLDGDGVQDAAILLTVDSGGSGTFYYLYAARE